MQKDKTHNCFATLSLVCTPIPNSLAANVTGNITYMEIIRQSDFYVIGGRPQASFCDFYHEPKSNTLCFSLEVAGGKKDTGLILLDRMTSFNESLDNLDIEIIADGSVLIISVVRNNGEKQPIACFRPDTILMWRGRKELFIKGLDLFLELSTYDLLYVGIAKKGDTYDRLFAKGHQARMQILASEPQRFPGARVSDEIYLFPFKVEPLFINVFKSEYEIEQADIDFDFDSKKLVIDAEKAMVSLLKPKYNYSLYPNYPRGKDGLYESGLTTYSYAISEGMAFRTAYGTIKGARERELTFSNEADFIMVKGDNVSFHISGVDFPAK
ncbi:hypothetical protein Selin_2066 [Desulfurispirillum indicum S5]|uniref:Uncharacterized protein n=1 Tax=Desulfurispirillum indicum (strain ATCC BAA-1389 / DSM 22839 / S5) TaxID=653733 RepID=E6W2W1_DESIS|nr:hypothetical protein [Desulfurispirillum indicum]ADU66786.1 hypothetical protein Selin_2066 [Desulfurispirillum indicum S5]